MTRMHTINNANIAAADTNSLLYAKTVIIVDKNSDTMMDSFSFAMTKPSLF